MWQIPSPSEAKRRLLIVSMAPLLVMLAVIWSLQTVGSTQAQDPSVDPQVAMTFTVTTAADSGDDMNPTPGSLRQAILNANANAGTDTINFSIAGAGPHTIALMSALPIITEAVIINGTSQTGYAGTPVIVLSGISAGAAHGLVVNAGGTTVQGLAINRFSGHGLVLNSSGNTVTGNYIGTDASGTVNLGNSLSGILITGGNNLIGSSSPGSSNLIAFNGGSGVLVASGTGNGILRNSIFSNAILGIDLGGNGVTPNDQADGDTGANNLQNFPTLTSASSASGSVTIQGTLDSRPSTVHRVEFFSNSTCSPAGFGEGQTFIGSATVTTDVSGNATFTVTLPASVVPGQVITATATDPANNTSEFSRCLLVGGVGGGGGGGSADLGVTITISPSSVQAGSEVTKTIFITNTGPGVATNVTMTDTLPNSLSFVSCSTAGGGVCGGSGNVRTVTFASLAAGSSAVVTLVTRVNCTLAGGIPVGNTAAVFSSTTPDPNPANNLATASATTINPPPVITCPGNITRSNDSGQCSAIVQYPPLQVTDNCPGATIFCSPPSGSAFAAGTTPVNCTATDSGGATATCSFTVTITDVEPLTVICPSNVTVETSGSQCSPSVTYPTPRVVDNCPGATVSCVPPSGSIFPVGTSLITCTARDARGATTTCTFTVTVLGLVQVNLVLEGDSGVLEFGPISAAGKSRKLKKQPGRNFTVENTGCSAFTLSLESIRRLGTLVNQGIIDDPDDQGLFSVYLIDPSGTMTKLEILKHVTVTPGQKVKFRVTFNPVIPAVVRRSSGLRAIDVIPDLITSRITFRLGNGTPLIINLIGRVTTEVQLTNPNTPKFGPLVTFIRQDDEFIAEYTIYDSNLDVTRAAYQFFDKDGRPAQGEIGVDLTALVRDGDFVKGQTFTVQQRFTGAKENKKIRGVRVSVFDDESSSTANSSLDQTTSITTQSFGLDVEDREMISAPILRLERFFNRQATPGNSPQKRRMK